MTVPTLRRGAQVPTSLPSLPPRVQRSTRTARLAGRVAVVTGAAGVLGGHIVEDFLAEGCAVLVSDLDGDRAKEKARALSATHPGAGVIGYDLDVTDPRGWQRAMRVARRCLGPVDLLVNNAGLVATEGVDELGEEVWQRLVSVNQTAVWQGIQACLPTMWLAGGGSVVNVGSVFGQVGSGASFAYHATKGAVQAMTVAAAVELAPRRIRVNAVLPGLLRTPMTADLGPEVFDAFEAATPIGTLVRPTDVAAATTFLASEAAALITGVCLPVDGGYTAR